MDNVCHTLVGIALAKAGLERRTRYATAMLAIGANFPDVDVVAVPLGHSIGWRRGVTHGVLALAILPFVLTGLVLLWDQWCRRRGRVGGERPSPAMLLQLAVLSILTHPALDFMNVYGVRWLSPFSDRWFYADALFIVDPWLWLILFGGVVLSARRRSPASFPERPARVALVASAVYVSIMLLAADRVRQRVTQELSTLVAPGAPTALLVAPIAVNPIRRDVMFEQGAHYRFASTTILGDSLVLGAELEKGDDDPDVLRALSQPAAREFLHWARFPFFRVERAASGTVVHIADARYTRSSDASWASVSIHLPPRLALPADTARRRR